MSKLQNLLNKIKGMIKIEPKAKTVFEPSIKKQVKNAAARTKFSQSKFKLQGFDSFDSFLDYVLNFKFATPSEIKDFTEIAVSKSANPDKDAVRNNISPIAVIQSNPALATAITEFIIGNMPEIIALMAKETTASIEQMGQIIEVLRAATNRENHRTFFSNQTYFPNFEETSDFLPNDSLPYASNVETAVRACPQVAFAELTEFVRNERMAQQRTNALNEELLGLSKKYNELREKLLSTHEGITAALTEIGTIDANTATNNGYIELLHDANTANSSIEILNNEKGWLTEEQIEILKALDPTYTQDVGHFIGQFKSFARTRNLVTIKDNEIIDFSTSFDGTAAPLKLVAFMSKQLNKQLAIAHPSQTCSYSVTTNGITLEETNIAKIKENSVILTEKQDKVMRAIFTKLTATGLTESSATSLHLKEVQKSLSSNYEELSFVAKKELYNYILSFCEHAKEGTPTGTLTSLTQFYVDHLMMSKLIENIDDTIKFVEQIARTKGITAIEKLNEENNGKKTQKLTTLEPVVKEYETTASQLATTRSAILQKETDLNSVCEDRKDIHLSNQERESLIIATTACHLPFERDELGNPTYVEVIPQIARDESGVFVGFEDKDITQVQEIDTEEFKNAIEKLNENSTAKYNKIEQTINEGYETFAAYKQNGFYSEIVKLINNESSDIQNGVINHTQAITSLAASINEIIYEKLPAFDYSYDYPTIEEEYHSDEEPDGRKDIPSWTTINSFLDEKLASFNDTNPKVCNRIYKEIMEELQGLYDIPEENIDEIREAVQHSIDAKCYKNSHDSESE